MTARQEILKHLWAKHSKSRFGTAGGGASLTSEQILAEHRILHRDRRVKHNVTELWQNPYRTRARIK